MTKLERLWDDYPTGTPPTADILRAARQQGSVRRRRLLVRPVLVAATAVALGAAFVAGTLVDDSPAPEAGSPGAGSPAGPGSRPLGSDASPVAFRADLEPARSCEELLDSYIDRGTERVTAYGWGYPPIVSGALAEDGAASARESDRMPTAASGQAKVERQTSSDTGTNVQEAGVDEPDTVKTDGELLVRLRGSDLEVHDVGGRRVRELASLHLDNLTDGELLLSGSTVTVLGGDATSARSDQTSDQTSDQAYGQRSGTRVYTVSLADPAEPEVTDGITYDARLLSARQHGSGVRLVLSAGLPDLDFVQPSANRSEQAALEANRALVEKSSIDDWLPHYSVEGGTTDQRLVGCGDVAVPEDAGLDTVAVTGFDSTAPTTLDSIALAGATTIAYESTDHLYLASSPATWGCWDCFGREVGVPSGEPSGTSRLYDFALSDTSAAHVASGEVEGTIADRWSLDEAGGVLRVAVGPSSETGDFNSVVTFRRQGTELVEHGRLDGLGRGEDIMSVRWFDDLAVLVTFRRVDPLYAVDLGDTRRPRLLSRLKIPGFSAYLHPLGAARMLGVGEGPAGKHGWGAQLGLFDVTDLADVRRIDALSLAPGSRPRAGDDPRQLTWLPRHRTVLTVVERGRAGYVSVVRLRDGRMSNRMVRVEYGSDTADVRTLGLPDGRVVLVTGEDVRFFAL